MIARGRYVPCLLAAAAMLLGSAALAIRPAAVWSAAVVVAAVGAIGVVAPLPSHGDARRGRAPIFGVVALGIAAFATARAITTPLPAPVTVLTVGGTVVAAVAEEIFFRRLVYGWLAAAGDTMAIVGAA